MLRTIRRLEGPRIPVVVVSAWTTPDHRAASADAGADAFVAKPFAPEELAATVSELLG